MNQDNSKDGVGVAYLEEMVVLYEEIFEKKIRHSTEESIIFLPTNGVGIGHMTRLLTIARKIRRLNSKIEIIFFTTSYGREVIKKEGFEVYYFPSRDLCDEEVISSLWNKMVQKVLMKVMDYYKPKCLVFDGAFPYLGILMSMSAYSYMKKIWIKGNSKIEGNEKIKKKENYFDLIIQAGEGGTLDTKNSKYYYSNPIIYFERNELIKRSEVREMLGIPKEALVVYIQLGVGKINLIEDDIKCIIETIQKKYEVYVLVGESIIGKPLQLKGSHITIIRDYPNSRYFRGVDIAFCAPGYNTFHELIYFGVPTIFIPNQQTHTDNQISRAEGAARVQAARVIYNCTEEEIKEAFEWVMNNSELIRDNALKLIPDNGAQQVAVRILNFIK